MLSRRVERAMIDLGFKKQEVMAMPILLLISILLTVMIGSLVIKISTKQNSQSYDEVVEAYTQQQLIYDERRIEEFKNIVNGTVKIAQNIPKSSTALSGFYAGSGKFDLSKAKPFDYSASDATEKYRALWKKVGSNITDVELVINLKAVADALASVDIRDKDILLGIYGNLYEESNIRTDIIESHSRTQKNLDGLIVTPNGVTHSHFSNSAEKNYQGFGLVQWTYERAGNFIDYAFQKGVDPTDAIYQAWLITKELQESRSIVIKRFRQLQAMSHQELKDHVKERLIPDHRSYADKMTYQELKQLEASRIWLIFYEGPDLGPRYKDGTKTYKTANIPFGSFTVDGSKDKPWYNYDENGERVGYLSAARRLNKILSNERYMKAIQEVLRD